MSGYRVRLETGRRSVWIAPELHPAVLTHDRFAARRFRSRLNANIAARRWNASQDDLGTTIKDPAFVEEFD